MGFEGRAGRATWRVVLAACTFALLGGSSLLSSPGVARGAGKPNFLVIITDDQRIETLNTMPTVQSELVDKGVNFTQGFVSNALCCPSRTSILTGRYSHTTGVWTNHDPDGGFGVFDDRSTLPVWLQNAGYRTALFGKYLNSYDKPAERTQYIPPGWDEWVALAETKYFDYNLNVNGHLEYHGDQPGDYSTDVIADRAASYIRNTNGPLFMFFDPFAPHAPAVPAPRYASAFSDLPAWDPPSYNEANTSDKPAWVREIDPLGDNALGAIQEFRRNQYATLMSVDDAVARLISALRATDRLDNTFILFISDNGIEWGEHRWHSKQVPYEESIRIPFIVRYDPLIRSPRTDSHLVVNVDIAPTIADLAGVHAHGADGESMVPLLSQHDPPWRNSFLIEHVPNDPVAPPPFCGVRTNDYTYVYYGTGEEELYDLHLDPYELTNVADQNAMAPVVRDLRDRLLRLCRPAPPGVKLFSPQPSGDGSGDRRGDHGRRGQGGSGAHHGNGGHALSSGGQSTTTTTPTPSTTAGTTPTEAGWLPDAHIGQSDRVPDASQDQSGTPKPLPTSLAAQHADRSWIAGTAEFLSVVIGIFAVLTLFVVGFLALAPNELLARIGVLRRR